MLIYVSEEEAKRFVDFADKSASRPIKKFADAIREQL